MSKTEHHKLVSLKGDRAHPYTKGKLCAKGFSFPEKNGHRDRLKDPYYQEKKGSGRFKKITWEKAYELIIDKMMEIHGRYGNFLPLAFYKGTGNRGIHHYAANEFFSSLGGTTELTPSMDNDALLPNPDPASIRNASVIFIWGANPAASNIHLIPYLIEAKTKGAQLVAIDPVLTETAELADAYIQPIPGTDHLLAALLLKKLIDKNKHVQFVHKNNLSFFQQIMELDSENAAKVCGINNEALQYLEALLENGGTCAHLIGAGPLKHSNSRQTLRFIEALSLLRGDEKKDGGGIFLWQKNISLFSNQQRDRGKNRIAHFHSGMLPSKWDPPIEMLWITCGNPAAQEGNVDFVRQFINDIPFVVTVDQFLTPTGEMSNLILPTTSFFEEADIVVNGWHGGIAFNEKALPPYFNSKSEWRIMTELGEQLNQKENKLSSFPLYKSEEDYLNAQFNDAVFEKYYIKNIQDLRKKKFFQLQPAGENKGDETLRKDFFQDGKNDPLSIDTEKMPNEQFPFWLLTPHHPYKLNSQFHFLQLTEEREAHVKINPDAAKKLGIFDGEIVTIYNQQGDIKIKAKFSKRLPKDILFIYGGWDPRSKVMQNRLVSSANLYDTFVNIRKL